jgi:hypothetical protein
MLGCYILCSESQGGSTDNRSQRLRLVDWVKSKSKVEAVQHGKGIDNKSKRSTNKRSIGGRVAID